MNSRGHCVHRTVRNGKNGTVKQNKTTTTKKAVQYVCRYVRVVICHTPPTPSGCDLETSLCMMAQRTGVIKSIALVAGFVSVLGIAIYPIIIDPKLHPEKYSKTVDCM